MTAFALLEEDRRYMIDSDGNVYGPKAVLKPTPRVNGNYSQVTIGQVGKRYVHRLVAQAFCPNSENKPDVAHGDNNGLNNQAWNLRWATESENMADKKMHGTHTQGEKHGKVKLSDEDVRNIRYWKAGGVHVDALAASFGVSRWTIYDACNPKRRKLTDY